MIVTNPDVSPGESLASHQEGGALSEVYRDQVLVRDEGNRTVLTVTGNAADVNGARLVTALRELDPVEHPLLTLDLREATGISPLVVHALLAAWERRWCQVGCIRAITGPGAVQQYLDSLRLHNVLVIEHSDSVEDARISHYSSKGWETAQTATVEQLRTLLLAAQNRNLSLLKALAWEATPLCVASGALEGGTASGCWCAHCPMTERFGGCRPLVDPMPRAAGLGDWEVAELPIMALIAEAAACTGPEHQTSPGDKLSQTS